MDSPPAPSRPTTTGLVLTVPALAPVLDRTSLPTVPTAAAGAPPHVTVLFPWVPGPVAPADLARLETAVRGAGAVTLTFARLGTFADGGVLFLRPDPEEEVRRLVHRVLAAFPDQLPYGGRHGDPVPHLTVALAAPAELPDLEREVAAALAPQLPVTVTVAHLSVLEQVPGGRWHETHRVSLG
ncbi:2'-5' RNA ligase family protein [Kineococcus sp. R8]|uniref:2'-5' RNA ligase family protein n=1 Tax=Kineococcus siccus TaxID=2696567 RepID=UPI00141376D0|nr:2'-5' RNA ligase family protein [Kineococcus siccus]